MLGAALEQVGLEGPTNGDGMTQTIADRIDYWIRRHVIQYWHEAHPSQYKLSAAQDKRIGSSATGQCPKHQYGAFATPMPPHLPAVEQLQTQKQE
jgi:hypothetical protein